MLEYVNRLARRRTVLGNAVVEAVDIQDLLKKVKLMVIEEDYNQFVEKLHSRQSLTLYLRMLS